MKAVLRWRRARELVRATLANWQVIALAASYLVGWVLLTWGVARLLVPEVWPISGGLFFLSLGGLGLLKDVATEGLYVLSKTSRRSR